MRILITGGSGFIGTNLVEKLLSAGTHAILNLDNVTPKSKDHLPYWKLCDILDADVVEKAFKDFRPEVVIHLAARTDVDPRNTIEDYKVNTDGSANLLKSIKNCGTVTRAVFTSTQFVHQYHGFPKDDYDFAPHTIYGESKVIMEKSIRSAGLKCTWTIIRPTNIWGPWHLRYPFEFWKVVSRGLYVHPGRTPVIRSYGYVGNVVHQILTILDSPSEKVNECVFYVGDMPIDMYDWANGFSVKQTGKNVRVVPRWLVRSLALGGDVLSKLRIVFPITSSRYRSMTQSNIAPMEKTFQVLGPAPYSLNQGLDETVKWMRVHCPELVTTSLK